MAPNNALSPAQLARLTEFDTPTVCNVIELFDVRPFNTGYLDHRIQCRFPELKPMIGYASTATFGADAPLASGTVYKLMGRQIESFARLPGPPIMVIQDLDDPSVAATFGEIMCSTYQAFGAVGLITSGAGRDLDQVQAIGFPVFTGGTICSHGYCHIKQLDVPVRAGGLTIEPGTLLHGDRNGVTTIPDEIALEVADACAEFVSAENVVLEYLRQGSPTLAGHANAAAEAKELQQKLAASVRARPR